ncbi:MFS transporter [Paraliobacillus ryukyuensis]|uniref:MFS transporter n=1 Tax=Paraliobacillus ryukyuensis TaxID=200904 RepID=UPI0009A91577|nr:MFS transporter [Paraliobacillus ryukyuensis]
MKKLSKREWSWVSYDWGNSAFSIIITTAVFPIYYKAAATEAGIATVDSTAYLGYTISTFTFVLAMLAPVLGTIADYQGLKKRFFSFFFILGVGSTALLAVVANDSWLLLLILYLFASIGSTGANVYYDAFLVDVTTRKRMNRVSASGYAMGYIGSAIPFFISIAIILLAQQGILPVSSSVASKIAFAITALWWASFSIPLLRLVKQRHGIVIEQSVVRQSFKRLGRTFKEIKQYRAVFLFLLAYFFYIDGVGTIISMSTAYGKDLGLGTSGLLVVLLMTQVVAAPFAIFYGKLAERFKGKKMIYVGIVVYMIVCIYAIFLETIVDFWILAMLVATSQGGIQALSRAYFAKIIPKNKSNEFFGFYNIFGKFASITGPFLVGITAQLTGNTSFGVFSLIILFIIGFILLLFVPETASHTANKNAQTEISA